MYWRMVLLDACMSHLQWHDGMHAVATFVYFVLVFIIILLIIYLKSILIKIIQILIDTSTNQFYILYLNINQLF